MQIKAYTLYHQLKQSCDIPTHIILYYYSRNSSDSAKQGKILDKIASESDTRIFAIEYNYSKELKFLEDYYGISSTPTLVIDYSVTKTGLVPFEKLSQIVS